MDTVETRKTFVARILFSSLGEGCQVEKLENAITEWLASLPNGGGTEINRTAPTITKQTSDFVFIGVTVTARHPKHPKGHVYHD